MKTKKRKSPLPPFKWQCRSIGSLSAVVLLVSGMENTSITAVRLIAILGLLVYACYCAIRSNQKAAITSARLVRVVLKAVPTTNYKHTTTAVNKAA